MLTDMYTGLGPYEPGQEAKFKADYIRDNKKRCCAEYFCIETEETEPGFPDTVWFMNGRYGLVEFKVSDKNGYITFKKSQPLFYRRHPSLYIRIYAWDVPHSRFVILEPEDVLQVKSLRVNLSDETLGNVKVKT
jgi:hypothetical protein